VPARLRYYPPEADARGPKGDLVKPADLGHIFDVWPVKEDDRPRARCEGRMWTRDGRLACAPGGTVLIEELPLLVTDEEHRRRQREEASERGRHHDPGHARAGDG
jgi:hypothetical protein